MDETIIEMARIGTTQLQKLLLGDMPTLRDRRNDAMMAIMTISITPLILAHFHANAREKNGSELTKGLEVLSGHLIPVAHRQDFKAEPLILLRICVGSRRPAYRQDTARSMLVLVKGLTLTLATKCAVDTQQPQTPAREGTTDDMMSQQSSRPESQHQTATAVVAHLYPMRIGPTTFAPQAQLYPPAVEPGRSGKSGGRRTRRLQRRERRTTSRQARKAVGRKSL